MHARPFALYSLGIFSVAFLGGSLLAFAAPLQQSPNYQNGASSFSSGGAQVSSPNYQVRAVGSPIGGQAQSASYITQNGITLRQVTVTPPAPTSTTPTPSTGGGGGNGGNNAPPPTPQASVELSGRAFPSSRVTILKDGQRVATTIAGPDAVFRATVANLVEGTYVFGVYGEDKNGTTSETFSFPTFITAGSSVAVSGIFLSPTIDVSAYQIKRGDNLVIFGQSAPQATINIAVHSEQLVSLQTTSDAQGTYLYTFDTSPLEEGSHEAKSKTVLAGAASDFSRPVGFQVGTSTAPKPSSVCKKADLNCDGTVNLVDFSIAAYWHKRPLSVSMRAIEAARLNNDGAINLVDFSILAYHWTG